MKIHPLKTNFPNLLREHATHSWTTDARERKINLSMTLAIINPTLLIMHTGHKQQLRRGRTLFEKY